MRRPHAGDPLPEPDLGPRVRRGAGELCGQGADALFRHAGPAEREHPHEKAREGVRGLARVIGQHAREEGLEHFGAERSAQSGAIPPVAQAGVRAGDQRLCGRSSAGVIQRARATASLGETSPLRRVAGESGGVAQRMPQLGDAVLTPYPHPDRELSHPERVDIDPPADGRVGRVEHLEAAIEKEPVDLVGALPPSHSVTRLEHDDLVAGGGHAGGAPQAGQPRSDDDDLVSLHAPHDKRRERSKGRRLARWSGA